MPCPPLTSLSIPVLETRRLRLRGHQEEDFPHSCQLWSDLEVVRYTVGSPLSPEDVWSRFLRYFGLWSLLGYGYWVVEEKATGAFVGELGLCDFHRDLKPPLNGVPEIGWTLLPAFHGKGYATEAAHAAMDWAIGPPLFARELACIMNSENAASLRVASKCGFRTRYTTTYKGWETLVLFANREPS